MQNPEEMIHWIISIVEEIQGLEVPCTKVEEDSKKIDRIIKAKYGLT